MDHSDDARRWTSFAVHNGLQTCQGCTESGMDVERLLINVLQPYSDSCHVSCRAQRMHHLPRNMEKILLGPARGIQHSIPRFHPCQLLKKISAGQNQEEEQAEKVQSKQDFKRVKASMSKNNKSPPASSRRSSPSFDDDYLFVAAVVNQSTGAQHRNRSRACAKMLVQEGWRCQCHFVIFSQCPTRLFAPYSSDSIRDASNLGCMCVTSLAHGNRGLFLCYCINH